MINPLADIGYEEDDLMVTVSELLVATADDSDDLIDGSVSEVLKLLRERMNMDVVFVSEFTDGQRVFRHVEAPRHPPTITVGGAGPLEESWCQRVVDGRLPGYLPDTAASPEFARLPQPPFPIGTHLSTPIVLKDGTVYGTLCCFSFGKNDKTTERDMKHLQYTAQLAAGKLRRGPSVS